LREYLEDIPNLVENFIKEANSTFKTSIKNADAEALKALMKYDFPGNVRQLRNFINQAVIMADSSKISIKDLPDEIFAADNNSKKNHEIFNFETDNEFASYHEEKEKVIERFTSNYFSTLLRKTSGNMMQSAKIAGISRVALYKIVNRYKIGQG